MKFCPECGAKLEGSPKFCPECGTKFTQTDAKAEPLSSAPEPILQPTIDLPKPNLKPAINAHELGTRLEEIVESIFKADGYSTERRQRIQGIKKYTNEIDIIAIRKNEKIAIECKNLSGPAGISQVRDFAEKILDLGTGWRGIFVSNHDFTEDASQFAESRNIEQIGHDEIMEKWFALSVGRSGKRGEKITIEHALQLNTNFIDATHLDLINKDKVTVTDVKLVYHPYIRYKYHFKRLYRDPAKGQHNFDDHGTVVIDLLDNRILNAPPVRMAVGVAQALTQTFSVKGRQENLRRTSLLHEVIANTPLGEASITISQDYRITKLTVDYSKRDLNRIVLEYIIDKNSRTIQYTVDSTVVFSDMKTVEFVPAKGDIHLEKGEVVYVPKWEIHFNAFGIIYSREVLACSGKILEDTIAYCPDHFKMGILQVRKKNTAVCEKCGAAFCNDHILTCEVCKKMICKMHAIVCSSCKKAFCEDHISKKCGICGGDICDACARVCSICGKKVGNDHILRCDVCGKEVCSSCVTVSGLIKKKKTCKKCG